MSYYSYHKNAQKLVKENHLLDAIVYKKYKSISPALVLYFDNHKPMPIRDYKFKDYIEFLKDYTSIKDPDNILYMYFLDTGNL